MSDLDKRDICGYYILTVHKCYISIVRYISLVLMMVKGDKNQLFNQKYFVQRGRRFFTVIVRVLKLETLYVLSCLIE